VHSLSNRMAVLMAGLACVIALSLTGCAPLQPEDSEQWHASQRPVLKERAEARWDALIKGDFEKAYSFTTPEYRDVVSMQQYKGKYGRVLDWQMAKVLNVSYDDPAVATVSVEVRYRVDLPGIRGEVFETQKTIPEKWLYKDRKWWFVSN